MFFDKFNNIKIRPDNQFGRILNKTSKFFAIFGGLVLLIAALISIFSIFAELEVAPSKRVHLGGNLQMNSYTTTFQQEAWNLPKIEGSIFGKYQKNNWYPLNNNGKLGKKDRQGFADFKDKAGLHYSEFTKSTPLGFRGPMIKYSSLKDLPKVYWYAK